MGSESPYRMVCTERPGECVLASSRQAQAPGTIRVQRPALPTWTDPRLHFHLAVPAHSVSGTCMSAKVQRMAEENQSGCE